MKTFRKTLCVVLSVIMAFSCVSFAALAEGETVTSSTKYYSEQSDAYNAKVTLDKVDEALKAADIHEEVDLGILGDIEIDFRSINALCNTIDDYYLLIRFATVLPEAILGNLKDLNLKGWKSGMTRTKDDELILKEFLELANANRSIVSKICDGTINLGVFEDYVSVSDILGPDGISGMLKEAVFSAVYAKDTPEYTNAYNTYKNNVDAFIYEHLIPNMTKDALPGLTLDETTTVEELLCNTFNIITEKYIVEEVKKMNIDLFSADIPVLKALDGIVNLDGSTYDFSLITLDPSEPVIDQLNGLIGAVVKQMVPAYAGWEDGGYDVIDDNYEDLLKYIGKKSELVPDADKLSLEELVTKVATLTLSNGDFGAYVAGIENCKNLEEIVTVVLKNVADEWCIGAEYDADDSCFVVLGDLFAYWFSDEFDVKSLNGKSYQVGGGKDIFEVANYFMNYFLFDKDVAAAAGLSTTKSESVFKKIDKILDYFGETKSKGVSFNSEEFLLGSSSTKGLIESVFTFDIENILDLTIVPALNNAGDVPVIEFMYKTVQYSFNNWAGKTLLPAYKDKAFTNALTNSSIANMVSGVLEVLNSRNDAIVALLTYAASMLSSEPIVYNITKAVVEDCVATDGKLYPDATVVVDGKTLKPGKDYIVQTTAKTPGEATATIRFTGNYEGTIERSFNILLGKVKKATCMSTTNSIKLVWDKVPCADGYNIYLLKNGSYKLLNDELVTVTQFVITGLSAATEYDVRIDAVRNSYGAREGSKIDVATVPGSIKASSIKTTTTASKVKLTWSAVSSASHYKVERYAGSNKWKQVTITNKTEATASGLDGYTTYNFRITPLKKLSDGSYISGTFSSVKAKTTLGAVTNVSVSYTSNSLTIKWDAVKNAQAYQILQYKNNKWVTVTSVKSGITSYKVTGLKAATKYQYAVRAAVKEDGKWKYGAYKSVTQHTGLVKPKTFKVSATTASAVKITWSKVSNAKNYQVFQYVDGKWVRKGTTKNTSAIFSKLASGTKYYFKVRAVTTVGGKNLYGDATASLAAVTLPGKVTNVKLVKRSTNSIAFSWSKVKGATSYQIFRLNNGKWVSLGTTTATKYTDSKALSKGQEYQYKVRAVMKVGSTKNYGAASAVFKAKTTRIGSSVI